MNLLKPKFLIPTFFAAAMLCFFWWVPGNSWKYTFVPGMIISYIFYLLTAYKKAPEPKVLLPLYLLGVSWYGIHFAEEFLNGYTYAFPGFFNEAALPKMQFLSFNMVALCFYIFGGICIYLKIQGPQLIAIFFIIFGMFGNALMHLYFQFSTGTYFPGFYTALPYLISPIGIYLYWKLTR